MAILTVYVSDEKLNEMLKEAHETNCSHKIKDFLIGLGANPNSLGISMYDIITMTPNVAWDVYKRELESKKPDIELITNLFDNSILNINDINEENGYEENGYTALIRAISYRKKEIYKLLLQRADIDVNVQDEKGRTALYWASFWGHTQIVKTLLKRPDIDVNVQENRGWTALMWASEKQNCGVLDALLKHPKIDVSIKNKERKTAWSMASEFVRSGYPKLKP